MFVRKRSCFKRYIVLALADTPNKTNRCHGIKVVCCLYAILAPACYKNKQGTNAAIYFGCSLSLLSNGFKNFLHRPHICFAKDVYLSHLEIETIHTYFFLIVQPLVSSRIQECFGNFLRPRSLRDSLNLETLRCSQTTTMVSHDLYDPQ